MIAVVLLALACTLGAADTAYAFDETGRTSGPFDESYCGTCHDPWSGMGGWPSGVHGGYATSTSKCEECHTVHGAPADSSLLLPAATIEDTCFTCHDGTQGTGVYGAIAAHSPNGGSDVKATHSVDTTNVVPGGDANTGGSATMTFAGQNGDLTCTDCHSIHAAQVVAPFMGDRLRSSSTLKAPYIPTTRLLKQHPGGSATAVAKYGSDWCLACHKGRASNLATMHNHPVDSAATTSTPFTYDNVAIVATPTVATGVTKMGPLGSSNLGYLMPYPRTAQQQGHAPICQQCHEDARSVGTLSADGSEATVATYSPSLDGASNGDPRFQNFPHESTNAYLLVENDDDLCLNCHSASNLP